jgi:hypothetical protein
MAAAAFNEDAQADRILLFHEEFPNLLFSRWRHGDHGISPFVVGAPWGANIKPIDVWRRSSRIGSGTASIHTRSVKETLA